MHSCREPLTSTQFVHQTYLFPSCPLTLPLSLPLLPSQPTLLWAIMVHAISEHILSKEGVSASPKRLRWSHINTFTDVSPCVLTARPSRAEWRQRNQGERDGEQPPSKLPHHYCRVLPTSLSLGLWAWVRVRLTGKRGKRRRSTGRFVPKAPNYSLCFQFDPEATAQTNTGMLWLKTKRKKGEIKRDTQRQRVRDGRIFLMNEACSSSSMWWK